ncbi:unnamed protein product [Angiostrongylus costaricensis]|uniref:BZIP domain-containing protein n=1 Tax=Angiostrongylus costaricensis TaxID=334426 RepID=A0A0R3PL01_ANGCS|nr:unnamed protein product [Angiostrongylus costaricensis]
MKSEDAAACHPLFPTIPEPYALLAYHLPEVPQMMVSNSFLNPYSFSILPSFPDPMLFTLPVPTSRSSLCTQAVTFADSPHQLKNLAECSSQSRRSSHSTESGASSLRNTRECVSSEESCQVTSRLRRGRPQQDISDDDDDDPNSQKRRHRRLYARQYRAQIRHKVDEVKVLKAKLDEMKRTIEKLETTLESERREHQQNTILLNSVIQSKLIPQVISQ